MQDSKWYKRFQAASHILTMALMWLTLFMATYFAAREKWLYAAFHMAFAFFWMGIMFYEKRFE